MDPKIGSRWNSGEEFVFVVDAVEKVDGKDWIFYHNEIQDPQQKQESYSCYREAFTDRFREIKNGD